MRPLLRRVAGWLLVSAVFAGLCALGVWQWQRAEQKRVMEAVARAAERQPPVALPLDRADYRPLRQRVVQVRGHYDVRHQFLLDNQVRSGRAGYDVLTPLLLPDGRAVLVDRGWLAQGPRRSLLPDVSVRAGERTVQGRVHVPWGQAFRLGEDDATGAWPRVVQAIDFQRLARDLGRPLVPAVIRLAPGEPEGYRRDWPRVTGITRQRHLAYAVQWFGLAVAWLVLVIHYQRVQKRS